MNYATGTKPGKILVPNSLIEYLGEYQVEKYLTLTERRKLSSFAI